VNETSIRRLSALPHRCRVAPAVGVATRPSLARVRLLVPRITSVADAVALVPIAAQVPGLRISVASGMTFGAVEG
jgi:hypothetical protein